VNEKCRSLDQAILNFQFLSGHLAVISAYRKGSLIDQVERLH
jgi:hypothetical protein